MNRLAKFFHEFLHPHCERCTVERLEVNECDSCDVLRSQLEIANHEKLEILNRLLDKEAPIYKDVATPQVNKPRPRPWPVIKRELEEQDRIKAAALKSVGKPDSEIESLEKEVLSEVKVDAGNT